MMDYEALAKEIEQRAYDYLDPGVKRGMWRAAQIVREAEDAKVPDVGAHQAAIVGLQVDLEQKIAQVEVRLGKRLADLERAQKSGADEAGDFWRGAAWLASCVENALAWGRNYEDSTIPVADVRKALDVIPKGRR